MHAEYKRDVSHNYLILYAEEMVNTASYQVRILTGNTMSSILKCRMQGLDGKWLFYYDITSKQSIASFYEQRKIRGEDLEMILQGFLRVMEEMAEFLLNTEQLVLCPDYIFLDLEKKEVYFCCLPDYRHPVQEQFRELTEYFLPKLDHEDSRAVNLGYGIYRKAMESGLQLEHIKELVYRAEAEDRDRSVEREDRNEVESGKHDMREESLWKKEKDVGSWGNPEYQEAAHNEEKKKISHSGKAEIHWKLAAGCVAGVGVLIGILFASYLGYLPEIPMEAVLGVAIALMGIGTGCTWAAGKKKKRQEQSAEWRNKVQRELAGETGRSVDRNIEKNRSDRTEKGRTEKKTAERDIPEQVSAWQKEMPEKRRERNEKVREEQSGTEYDQQEMYGETVVLSAGQLSGPASLVSREPGELAPIYLERELTVIGKLEQASDAVISLPTVSRVHARIRKTGEEYYLADLNSRNGTSVNGRMLKADEEYLLQDEDQVDFAQARYVFLK